MTAKEKVCLDNLQWFDEFFKNPYYSPGGHEPMGAMIGYLDWLTELYLVRKERDGK